MLKQAPENLQFTRTRHILPPGGGDITLYGKNGKKTLRVNALWDDKAGVWCASSADVDGLAIEAATKEVLIERLKAVIPELLELNHTNSSQIPQVELVVKGHQNFRLAS